MIEKNCLGKHTGRVIRVNEGKLRTGKFKLNTMNILLMSLYCEAAVNSFANFCSSESHQAGTEQININTVDFSSLLVLIEMSLHGSVYSVTHQTTQCYIYKKGDNDTNYAPNDTSIILICLHWFCASGVRAMEIRRCSRFR